MKFNETYDLIVSDRKSETTRRPGKKWHEWYKHVNEWPKQTVAEGSGGRKCDILLTACFLARLGDRIANPEAVYREGFVSSEKWVEIWKRLYGGLDVEEEVCVIRFWPIPPDELLAK